MLTSRGKVEERSWEVRGGSKGQVWLWGGAQTQLLRVLLLNKRRVSRMEDNGIMWNNKSYQNCTQSYLSIKVSHFSKYVQLE